MSVKAATHGEDHGGLDAINGRWGRGKMRLASVSPDPDWGMRREMMSLSFTTRLDRFGRFIANELSFAIRHSPCLVKGRELNYPILWLSNNFC